MQRAGGICCSGYTILHWSICELVLNATRCLFSTTLLVFSIVIFCLLLYFFFVKEAPGSLSVTTNDNDIRASSLAIKWTAPVDDGGSAVTGYKLIILHDDNVILNETTSDGLRQYLVGGLHRNTTYTLRVSAMNRVFEGSASEKKATTKYEGNSERLLLPGDLHC